MEDPPTVERELRLGSTGVRKFWDVAVDSGQEAQARNLSSLNYQAA